MGHYLLNHSVNIQGTGLTTPLLSYESGHKFGKTDKTPILLDPSETSPFDFYQYFYRTPDSEVGKFMRLFTFLPLSRIKEIEDTISSSTTPNKDQKHLAENLTLLVHGGEEYLNE